MRKISLWLPMNRCAERFPCYNPTHEMKCALNPSGEGRGIIPLPFERNVVGGFYRKASPTRIARQ